MKIACCYVYPAANNGPAFARMAERFVSTYREHPPMMDHLMIVASNGGPPDAKAKSQFSFIEHTHFMQHDNSGKDVGAYQAISKKVICDVMVFFGSSTYFRGPGWLKRMIEVYEKLGPGLYGCSGHQGIGNIFPHVRTTAFWCSPKLINEHPFRVTDNSQRYEWEHGAQGLTTWARSKGVPVWVVGFNDVKPLHECNSMVGGMHSGNQEQLMCGDRLTSMPYHHCA